MATLFHSHIETLDLQNDSIEGSGFKALCGPLASARYLRELNLSHNKLFFGNRNRQSNGRLLSKALETSSINVINLSATCMTDGDLRRIAKVLVHRPLSLQIAQFDPDEQLLTHGPRRCVHGQGQGALPWGYVFLLLDFTGCNVSTTPFHSLIGCRKCRVKARKGIACLGSVIKAPLSN